MKIMQCDIEAAVLVLDAYDDDVDTALEACMNSEPDTAPLTDSDEPVTEDDRSFFLKVLRIAAGIE